MLFHFQQLQEPLCQRIPSSRLGISLSGFAKVPVWHWAAPKGMKHTHLYCCFLIIGLRSTRGELYQLVSIVNWKPWERGFAPGLCGWGWCGLRKMPVEAVNRQIPMSLHIRIPGFKYVFHLSVIQERVHLVNSLQKAPHLSGSFTSDNLWLWRTFFCYSFGDRQAGMWVWVVWVRKRKPGCSY